MRTMLRDLKSTKPDLEKRVVEARQSLEETQKRLKSVDPAVVKRAQDRLESLWAWHDRGVQYRQRDFDLARALGAEEQGLADELAGLLARVEVAREQQRRAADRVLETALEARVEVLRARVEEVRGRIQVVRAKWRDPRFDGLQQRYVPFEERYGRHVLEDQQIKEAIERFWCSADGKALHAHDKGYPEIRVLQMELAKFEEQLAATKSAVQSITGKVVAYAKARAQALRKAAGTASR